jgi:hypothetical protein
MSGVIESNKVVFREGRAWQLMPIGKRLTTVLKLVVTADFQPLTITQDSQVYLSPARPDAGPVAFQGTVLVRHGFIQAIRPATGTVTDSESALIEVLERLHSSGADLSGSWVIDSEGTKAVRAGEFIAKQGKWPAIAKPPSVCV